MAERKKIFARLRACRLTILLFTAGGAIRPVFTTFPIDLDFQP